MAKKKAAGSFNMSLAIRDLLQANSKLSAKEAWDALAEKHPGEKINKNSFSVAFYTGRNKLGIKSPGRGKKRGVKGAKRASSVMATRPSLDLYALKTAAQFLSEVGGADAALEAIKQVQALQVK